VTPARGAIAGLSLGARLAEVVLREKLSRL
jgi:hypothetical protein